MRGCVAAEPWEDVFSACKKNTMLITFGDGTERSEFYAFKT